MTGESSPQRTASAGHPAVIALGSNLGDTGATLRAAVRDLDATPGITVERTSGIHQTIAVSLDGPDPSRPRFANAVALISTTLEPLPLLHALQAIEQRHHRRRDVRWGDRTLDLDIVDIPGVRLQTAELTVPHVRAAERSFVLAPWAEIDPAAMLDGTPVAELLARVRSVGQEC
ncbi:2-amino-4-hydroxy-6-hydroxymethyldihydropteridine diphosphokinase [Pseudoclavibacter sp. 13-3]|uniref:2-amino-4-hydroxy-6- hydroxymethyldihydropteridine diphosphokinase n=1 Tax=Pseudoclavibacter sp. 13-3 TaxID=2901228 RepID=UPI001E3A28BC|nr:2-amino-4-hydroxy-6-hydroxymethyldihydropteridine diphosphokinase [Pseudoclavibacter sp. 13-3]MCD7101486.1 2-amino-4-hydroxy-6-hydroxymethyldihydropteridine diphosphokinase [Pseudoclavibacter sp. 13-3]